MKRKLGSSCGRGANKRIGRSTSDSKRGRRKLKRSEGRRSRKLSGSGKDRRRCFGLRKLRGIWRRRRGGRRKLLKG